MPAPSWLLIFWSGLAATCAAALLGSLLGGRATRPWALVARDSGIATFGATAAAGLFVYPALYGVTFELLASSSAATGLAVGTFHAVVAFVIARSAGPAKPALRVAIMHLCYGVVIAFLYVTP